MVLKLLKVGFCSSVKCKTSNSLSFNKLWFLLVFQIKVLRYNLHKNSHLISYANVNI